MTALKPDTVFHFRAILLDKHRNSYNFVQHVRVRTLGPSEYSTNTEVCSTPQGADRVGHIQLHLLLGHLHSAQVLGLPSLTLSIANS